MVRRAGAAVGTARSVYARQEGQYAVFAHEFAERPAIPAARATISGVSEAAQALWERYRQAAAGQAMPFALVDLEALEHNVRSLTAPLARSGKTLRIATKSIRCPELVDRIRAIAGSAARGLMTYTATETAFWAERGERDLLLAYPTVSPSDVALIAEVNAAGARASVVLDSATHLPPLAAAARARSTHVPVVLDVDMSFRPLGPFVHIGVRRSPLHHVSDVVALARRVAATDGLRFHGVMGYEAQIAGVADRGAAVKAMKKASSSDVARTRSRVRAGLVQAGLTPDLFNGGGTGSLAACAREGSLTEVTAGSGFLDSHLFDAYDGLDLRPAAYFALQVVRRPAPGLVTCHGGGYVASGAAGPDRLPLPVLPAGLSLLKLEGAGEVQTPLRGREAGARPLELGDPVFFRHAKAGELAEHFAEYMLVRGERVEARAPTYRGLQKCFLG
jgi:D-serine deaminase-like pyridoxal phosphate-dependent protein